MCVNHHLFCAGLSALIVAVLAELSYYPLSGDETQNFGLGLCVK